MKKRELLNLPTLWVTPEMRKLAKADEMVKRKYQSGGYEFTTENYQRKMYLRCIVEAEILKVGIYLPDHIKTGSSLPNFEVFVSKKENTFLTYDRANGRWLTAKLDRIDSFPIYTHRRGERWIGQADSDTSGITSEQKKADTMGCSNISERFGRPSWWPGTKRKPTHGMRT